MTCPFLIPWRIVFTCSFSHTEWHHIYCILKHAHSSAHFFCWTCQVIAHLLWCSAQIQTYLKFTETEGSWGQGHGPFSNCTSSPWIPRGTLLINITAQGNTEELQDGKHSLDVLLPMIALQNFFHCSVSGCWNQGRQKPCLTISSFSKLTVQLMGLIIDGKGREGRKERANEEGMMWGWQAPKVSKDLPSF